ncbi:MAG: hypothetical protein ABI217_09570 [Chthoniobacterales bacterium]
MNEQEARLILQACRPGEADRSDPEIAAALRELERNPELARWFAEEQAFDLALAAHLATIPAPFGLKTRLLAQAAAPATARGSRWLIGLAGMAALFFLFAQVAAFWRHPGPAASNMLPGYSSEMVSFIKLDPPLELMNPDLGAIKGWLAEKEALRPDVPLQLAALPSVGCRILSFRGHKVTLICFRRAGGGLAHLFVVDRAALPGLKSGARPVFQAEGEWTTASWAEGDRVYMIAAQGDRATVQSYLPDA